MEKNSQPTRLASKHFQQIIDEMKLMSATLKSVVITGGEPMLNNSLIDIIEGIKQVPDIKIFTGLGVDIKRFTNILAKLKEYPNVRIAISAESTDEIYEFNRYGVKWADFLIKIDLLKQHNIYYSFHSTLSNLTVIGYSKFRNLFSDSDHEFDLVYKPDFMAVYVLDKKTKDIVVAELDRSDIQNKEQIIQSILAEPTDKQQENVKLFLQEFTKRRSNLNVNIYPKEFLDWIEYVV
jgi:organic radical activating enzyme